MEYKIKGYEPANLFRFLEDVIAIPRGSGDEGAICDYIVDFAERRGLPYERDEANNVIVRKSASKGCEGAPTVILQGHSDIVCEKNGDVQHDFLKDPVKTVVEGDKLRAVGTTLGADNGVALAMMLDILSDESAIAPALECLFTSDEETSFGGAQALDISKITGRTLINLDSEKENEAVASCAGGVRVKCQLPIRWLPCPADFPLRVRVSGLLGGHSGVDIHKERGNANKLLARILNSLNVRVFFHLAGVSGGSKENAIPREAEALLVFESEQKREQAINIIDEHFETIAAEMRQDDPAFRLEHDTAVDKPRCVIDSDSSNRFISFTYLAPNGVTKRNPREGGVVASLNMGVISVDPAQITLGFALRSSIESLKNQMLTQIMILAGCFSFHTGYENAYPAWEFAPASSVRDVFLAAHEELYGMPGKVAGIHAGLECALFTAKIEGLDAIAIGPTVTGAHSPDETLDLPSLERTHKLLKLMLKKLAGKTSGIA